MKTLIVYGTKYGSTERCAAMLSEQLNGKVELFDLKAVKDVDLSQYDRVVIGGSMYMGKIQKEVSGFCSKNLNTLKDKKLGFYICCMREGDLAEKQLYESFPQELLTNSIACEHFGGEFIFNKMSFIDRLIVKKVSKVDKDTSNISEDKISKFAKSINSGF